MASNTDYLPDEITYGFVADQILLPIGDTNNDDDRYPDGVPAQGTVRFSPERAIFYTQQQPATILPQDIECTIYHRDHPVALEKGYEPEHVGKLVDPAGYVGNVALIVGWYEVVYRLSTGTAQRFRFQVKPEHTAETPLWLPRVAPLKPAPSERFVVNEQVYNDTKQARDEAEQFRDTTRTLRNETQTYRNQAEGYRNEAGQSATSAAEILSDVQDLGITVDPSVGTRVFVGDTMIYGDTGWRDVTELFGAGLDPENSGTITLRRRNYDVIIRLNRVLLLQGEGTLEFGPLPSGFRPISTREILWGGTRAVNTGQMQTFLIADNTFHWASALDRVTSGHPVSRTRPISEMRGTLTFPTGNSWPTSLSGSPA